MAKTNEEIGLEQLDTRKLSDQIQKHASESRNEEELKIEVEKLIDPIVKQWGIKVSYEHKSRHEISGLRKDALYGHVIIEYKKPGELESKAKFEKFKQKLKKHISEEAVDPRYFGRWFGVIIDGYKISFIRFRKNEWEEQVEPLAVNPQTVLRLLEAIRGLRRKPIDAEFLLLDFGPKSETSRKTISILYEALRNPKSARTEMLFDDWRRVFSQVCAYSSEKMAKLIDYYGLKARKDVDAEKLMFAIHTYYTILMKLLTSEIVTLFADSLLGSYLKKLEEAYYRSHDEMLHELKELEEGGIFATVGIRNFLEADYFAWYLDEWNEKIATSIFELTKKLLDYEPATVELNPERVKDLFKRLYQNLVPRDIRHRLGEYFTPDWLAELLLNEVEYDGSPDKRVLDPACGSGTFLVLTIKRIREYADKHFLDERELVRKIIDNVKGIDLNPLAVLASKANYLIALSDLLRYRPREGIEIPIYLADSVSVIRRATLYGEQEFELQTNEGRFWVTKEVIDKNLLYPVLAVISEGLKVGWTKEEFEKALSKKIPLSNQSVKSFIRLYNKILKLEHFGKNRIWASLLKNSFSPMLIGKFDYVFGNPPWINWENLPEFYRNNTKELWNNYGLLERTKGMGLGKVKRDMAMLFVARCFSQYVKEKGKLAFLAPFTTYKTQTGAGFRKFLANKCEVEKIHDLVELYPFEGAINRTSLLVIKEGKTKFPISCVMWHNPSSRGVLQEAELEEVGKTTKQFDMVLTPINKGKPETPWMIISKRARKAVRKVTKASPYRAYEGTNTALNGVYWINTLSKEPNGILIKNLSNVGRKKVREVTSVVEPDLVYPLIKGRDIKKWDVEPSCNIIVPHDPKTGKTLNERDMKVEFRKTYQFLFNFRKVLSERSIKKLLGKREPFYFIYGSGEYTFKPYKVIWKEIAGKISGKGEFSAAVIGSARDPYVGKKLAIPDHKTMFIPLTREDEAYFIAAVLNSSIAQLIVMSYTIETAISTHVVKNVYVPKFDPKDKFHQKLSSLSKKAHELAKKYYEQNDSVAQDELVKVEEEIDKTVAKLYGITDDELKEIKKTLKILKGEEIEEEEVEEEPIALPKKAPIEIRVDPLLVKENKPQEVVLTVSNNLKKSISRTRIKVLLKKDVLLDSKIKKISPGSSKSLSFKVPKLKKGEHDLKISIRYGPKGKEEKLSETRKLFVEPEEREKKAKSKFEEEIE